MPQPFIIYTSQRTGSTMLCDVLSKVDEVICFPELFRAFSDTPLWLECALSRGLSKKFLCPEYRTLHRLQLFDTLSKQYSAYSHIGFKLMSGQDKGFLNTQATRISAKVIHLYRDNLLAVYGAARQAQVTGKAHIKRGEKLEFEKVTFDSIDFSAFLQRNEERIQHEKTTLESLKQDVLSLEYLELTSANGINAIFDHLGISASSIPESTYVKRNSWDVLNRFANTDDVKRHLSDLGKPHWAQERAPSPSSVVIEEK